MHIYRIIHDYYGVTVYYTSGLSFSAAKNFLHNPWDHYNKRFATTCHMY